MSETTIRVERIKSAKILPWSVKVDGHEYARFLSQGLADGFATTTLVIHLANAEKAIAKLGLEKTT